MNTPTVVRSVRAGSVLRAGIAVFFEKAQPWLSGRSVAEIVELSQAMRIPAAPVNDGATALHCPQYLDREFFVQAGGDDWRFRRPGAPFRLSRTPALPPRPAPGWASSGRRASVRLRAGRRGGGSVDAVWSYEGGGPEHVLGGCVPHVLSRRIRCRDRESGIDTAARRVPLFGCMGVLGRPLVRAQRNVAGHQPEQA
jgi:CoA transferase family III